MFFGSAEPHRYFIDCFVCSLLNIKLVFRYSNYSVSHYTFVIIKSFSKFITIIKSIYSSIKIQIHFQLTSHLFSIVFPSHFPLSYPINDRDVNCCFNVYSSRISAVCFLLVLKIIFVIKIFFL